MCPEKNPLEDSGKKRNMLDYVGHTFEPVFDSRSKILLLGTMPSPKSRQVGFYYSHPQNRLWRVLAAVLSQDVPVSTVEKEGFLLRYNIAMWDVLASCQIVGADDNSIKDPVANDMNVIFSKAPIKAVFTTGKKATELYNRYCRGGKELEAVYLPSTSPANCRLAFDELVAEYKIILKYL